MRPKTARTALIGRSGELDLLLRVLDAAEGGLAGVALVGGDAGIGKTRLVNEVRDLAEERGFTVLVGQCAELGDALPYLPLVDALRGAAEGGTPAGDALTAWPALRRLLPGADPGTAGAATGALAQQQLFGSVLGLLAELAESRPVLFVFEDLHWADRSTRDLLVFLTRMLQRERVTLVGTYRTDDLHRRHPLRPVLAELQRLPLVNAIELPPLGNDDLAHYLATIDTSHRAIGGGVDLIGGVVERAGGNPFFAEELLAAAAMCDGVPGTLSDLLLSRVEALPDQARHVMRVAAVAGHSVDHDILGDATDLGEIPLEDALREIVSRGLLTTSRDGYAFRHALLQEAVYDDLLPGERTRLHGTFARLLAARGASAAELAHHYHAGHDLPGALRASVEAGRIATDVGAPAEAHRHFDRALEIWEHVTDAERLTGTTAVRIALSSAAAAADSGDYRRAVAQLRRLSPVLDDPLLISELNERIAYHLTDSDLGVGMVEAARTAVDVLPPGEPTPLLARALATYARAMFTTSGAAVTDLANRALDAARTVGARDAEVSALITLAIMEEATGTVERVEELLDLATATRSGDLSIDLRATFHQARVRYEHGELDTAARTAGAGIELAARTGLTWSAYGTDLRFLQFLIHYASGDWDTAELIASGFGVRVGMPTEAHLSSFALFIEVGRGSDAADERLAWLRPFWKADERDGQADSLVIYMARGLAAEQALWRGDPKTALCHVSAAVDTCDPFDPGLIRICATGLWALAEGASPHDARERADDLIERARWAAANGPYGPRLELGPEGAAWLLRAEAEWHRTRGTAEPELWRRAADAFGFGFVYEDARSRWRLAESLLDAGDREAARTEWSRALETADRLGAAPLRRALETLGLRARFSEPPQPVPAAGGGGLDTLTAREREVLEHVAAGLPNREIGKLLYISQKTVSVHVSNILAKLGVASRTQAAAIAHRRKAAAGERPAG
ncbi:helix-turn-helix transcriptional regulator [Microtetraspora sp. NBRC 16547]|uniref:helix-turn-helix transcriptional regulator n=1 Tax=Microtetraspora sp. NBRC 16547 TaxID=3030993 RepID=UPI0024A4FFA3|nr:helix-turn-helix transcriptional regulator [Microtetraspora sp. NBRC 16547]GLW96915.1 LuxR family transcriptional regulator [Microtetraspora sp. NBRC 16547]